MSDAVGLSGYAETRSMAMRGSPGGHTAYARQVVAAQPGRMRSGSQLNRAGCRRYDVRRGDCAR